jgi:hypothetical protein
MAEVPYQQAGQVRQLLNERENAVADGNTTRIEAVDKQLEALGYKSEKQAAKAADAAEERAAAGTAPAEQPQGRTTRQQATTTEGGTKAGTSAKASDKK